MSGFRGSVMVAVCVVGSGCSEGSPSHLVDAGGDAATDVAVDARPDSMLAIANYDVGYINEITFPFNYTGISGLLAIVNRGAAPLSLTKASVVSVSADNPAVTWTFELDAASTVAIEPGHAAGFLSQQATIKLVGSGLVPEPFDDTTLDFQMGFASFPPVGIDVHAIATIRIADAEIALPFLVHVVAGSAASELDAVARVNTRE